MTAIERHEQIEACVHAIRHAFMRAAALNSQDETCSPLLTDITHRLHILARDADGLLEPDE